MDFSKKRKRKKNFRREMSTTTTTTTSLTTHKYVRAQYERLLIALNDVTKYADTDTEKEQISIRYAYAVRNFTTSLSELEEELKMIEEKALKK